jgi:gluconolactonase
VAIEQFAPEMERIVSPDEESEALGTGYGNAIGPAEGPVWWKEEGYLLFSDIGNNRRMKYAPGQGVTLVQQPTNYANGLTRDNKGRLVACEFGRRRVARFEDDGSLTVVAVRYKGTLLNRPNDVVVKSDGSIYFTDPWTNFRAPGQTDLDFSAVYRVSPDLGTLTPLVTDFYFPNGLAFSKDESVLYINDSRRRHIRAFDVMPNGTLNLGSDRLFCDLRGERPGGPDGMKVDVEGNVYCTGPGGVWVIDPSGKHLGTILTGANQTTNCAWGGYDWKTLFITTMETMGRVQLKIAGIPVPR